MKKLLTVLLFIVAIGLCGLSVAQWLREAALRERIGEVSALLREENEQRVKMEEKAAGYENEIERISQLRADTEAKLLSVTEELNLTQIDQLQRGYSIAVLAKELTDAQVSAAEVKQSVSQTADAIKDRNNEVTAQNTAIEEANQRLERLTQERDQAITELNKRTKAYNELVEKYNKLAR